MCVYNNVILLDLIIARNELTEVGTTTLFETFKVS